MYSVFPMRKGTGIGVVWKVLDQTEEKEKKEEAPSKRRSYSGHSVLGFVTLISPFT